MSVEASDKVWLKHCLAKLGLTGADSERPVRVSCVAEYGFGEYLILVNFSGCPVAEFQRLDLY